MIFATADGCGLRPRHAPSPLERISRTNIHCPSRQMVSYPIFSGQPCSMCTATDVPGEGPLNSARERHAGQTPCWIRLMESSTFSLAMDMVQTPAHLRLCHIRHCPHPVFPCGILRQSLSPSITFVAIRHPCPGPAFAGTNTPGRKIYLPVPV